MKKLLETSKEDIEAFAEKLRKDILPKWIGSNGWLIDFRESKLQNEVPIKNQTFSCQTEIDDSLVFHRPFRIDIKIPVDDVLQFSCHADSMQIPDDLVDAYACDVLHRLESHRENFRNFYLKTNYNISKEEIIQKGLKYLSEGRLRSPQDMMKLRRRIELDFNPPMRFGGTKSVDYYIDGIKAGEKEYCATDLPLPIHTIDDFLTPNCGIQNQHMEKKLSDDKNDYRLSIEANRFGDAIVTYKSIPLKNEKNKETNGQWKDKIYFENKLVAEIRYNDLHTKYPLNAKIFGDGSFQDMLQKHLTWSNDARKDLVANLVFGEEMHQSTVIRLSESQERFAGVERMEKDFLASGGKEPIAYTNTKTR